jgi:eukaryotic-like serine/threonine-protein kinase
VRTGAVRSIGSIEGYRLDGEDDGAWGPVVRGERLADGKAVALRVFRLGGGFDWEVKDALQHPAVLALAHPHCVAVLEAGRRDRDAPLAVIERHPGETLRAAIDRGPLPIASALAVLGQILDGLAHAHDHGVIHGGVEPDAIWLTDTAHGPHVRLGDFETVSLRAALVRSPRRFINCKSGYVWPMQLRALAPERCQGRGHDARADLYAAGATLFEMVTGRPMYDLEGGLVAVYQAYVHEPTPRLADHVAAGVAIPRGLQALLDTATAKAPDDRFATARGFGDAVAALAGPR